MPTSKTSTPSTKPTKRSRKRSEPMATVPPPEAETPPPTPVWPDDTRALVTVTFNDGEIKTYPISAGPTIAGYLARQTSETGMLVLFTKRQAVSIPVENIREWYIVELGYED